MSAGSGQPRRQCNLWIVFLSIWLATASLGLGLHFLAYSQTAIGESVVVRGASNVCRNIAMPGWVFARLLLGSGPRDMAPTLIAYTLGVLWVPIAGVVAMQASRRLRAGHRAPDEPGDSERVMSRRSVLLHSAGAVGLVGGGAALAQASVRAPLSPRLKRYSIPIADLDASLDGFRIAFLSDVHFGPLLPASAVTDAVDRVREMQPDLVVLGGDYITEGRTISQTREYIDRVAELMSPLCDIEQSVGALAVLGNHDWWGDGHRMRSQLEQHGFRCIDNDRVFLDARRTIRDAPAQEGLLIAALGDLSTQGVDAGAAFRDAQPDQPCLLIAHQPDTAELGVLVGADAPRVDCMFCGHTHGGQVKLPVFGTPMIPSQYGQKYAGGLVRGPAFDVIVSRGLGMSMIPVRWGVPPEILEITLTRDPGPA